VGEAVRLHPRLGDLRWDAAREMWETDLDLFPGCPIRFAIVALSDWRLTDPTSLFQIASGFLESAREFEPRCRERIADDLLDVYNQWRALDDPDNGSLPHTRAEFLLALKLGNILLYPSGASEWWYDAGAVFAPHCISVPLAADRSYCLKAAILGGGRRGLTYS